MSMEPSCQVLRTAVRDAPTGIGVCDEDGRIVAVSTSLTRLLRRTRAEILGRPFLAFVHAEDRPRALASYFEAVVAVAAGVHDGRTTLRCLTGDQEAIAVEASWTVTDADEASAACGILCITALSAAAPGIAPASRTHQPAALPGEATAPADAAGARTWSARPHRPTL